MSLWRKMAAVWRVALFETKVMFLSVKFLVLSAVSWMFMDFYIREVRTFALDYGITVSPAQLPFYFSDYTYCNIAFLLLIFLLSDLPLRNGSQRQLLQRSGMHCFGAGQMLAVALTAAVYVAEQLVLSVLVCLPCLELGGWGKVWQSVANGTMMELGYQNYVTAPQEVITNYLPWQAIGASSLLFCLTGILYGLLVHFLNGISRGRAGTAVLSAWSLVWLLVKNFAARWKELDFLLRLSPANWNDLAGRRPPEIGWIALRILLCILVAAVINQVLMNRRKIEIV